MSRNTALIVAILVLFSIVPPSGVVAMPANTLTILPQDCTVRAGEELPLLLEGFSPDMVVHWNVDRGGITSMLPGSDAIFVAPPEAGLVMISVSISSAAPGAKMAATRQCTVIAPNNAPRGVAQAGGEVASSIDPPLPIN